MERKFITTGKRRIGRLYGAMALAVSGTAAVLLLVTPSAALADYTNMVYDQPIPLTSTSPANAAAITQSWSAIPWEVVSPVHGASLHIRVATQPVLGNDGTLSTLNMVGGSTLVESNTYGYYTGLSGGAWTNTPGQYFWQVFGFGPPFVDPNTGVRTSEWYASPVYTITIAAPQQPPPPPPAPPAPPTAASPSPIKLSDASQAARYMIRSHLHRTPQGRIHCTGLNTPTVHCKITWTASSYWYTATGRFWSYIGSDGNQHWWYDFKGTRTSTACMRSPHPVGCSRTFHWH
jgi:hypothetical protein